MKQVSVVIPSYNRTDTLKDAILSVCNQTYGNIEIIVVNDCGIDTRYIAKEISEKYQKRKIRYIRHEKNRGLAAARNTGIKNANGRYIAFLDDDDIFYPKHVEYLVRALEMYPNYSIAYSNAFFAEYKEGKQINKFLKFAFDFHKGYFLIENYIPVNALMYKKEIFQKYGGFDENLEVLEDYDLLVRLSRENDFIHVVENTCEVRRFLDEEFMSVSKVKIYKTYLDLYEKYPVPESSELLRFQRNHSIEAFNNLITYEKNKASLPKVSVIFLSNGDFEETKNSFFKISKLTFYPNIEIILLNNGSENSEVYNFFKDINISEDVLKIVNSKENIPSFLNKGANIATGEYLAFLLNYPKVFPHWLGILTLFAMKNSAEGMLSSKNVFKDLKINHTFLVESEREKELAHFGRFLPQYFKEVNVIREKELFCSSCFILKKTSFESVGGFDESLKEPLFLAELSKRLHERGFKNFYHPYSMVEIEKQYNNIPFDEIF